jgi:peptidoglycan/LPS O-acetylase OafA/YrhL
MYRFVLGLAYLSAPVVPFNFEGSPYPGVNVPLWSIQYEFFCYCLVPLILLWRGRAREWYALTVLLCLLYVVARWPGAPGFFALFSGSLGRLLMFFFMGGVVYFALSLHRPRYLWLIVSAVAMVFSLKSEVLFELAMASFGAYLLFSMMWAPALNGSLPRLNADVSYGVYLYGWPISKMLYSASPEMSAPMNAAVSLALAIIAGSLSWVVVEERFLRRNRSHVALKTSHGHSEKGGE